MRKKTGSEEQLGLKKQFIQSLGHNSYNASRNINPISESQMQTILNKHVGMFGIMDFVGRKYWWLSDTTKATLHVKPEFFQKDGISALMSCLFEEEAQLFMEFIYPTMFDYFQKSALMGKCLDTKITYCTRLILNDGSCRWFLHQIIPIMVDHKGMPTTGLHLMTDLEGIKKDDCIDLVVSHKDEDGIYRRIFEKSVIPKKQNHLISEREREVLILTSQGLSAKQISEELYISSHTVINHRKNMLKKLNIATTNQLIRFGMANGLIG